MTVQPAVVQSYFTTYRGYSISSKQDFGSSGYRIDGHTTKEGFVVGNAGHMNLMPAATWFQTVAAAKTAIDDIIAVNISQARPETAGCARVDGCPDFDSDAFWGRLRARTAAEKNVVEMTLILKDIAEGGDVSALADRIESVLHLIDDAADTRPMVHDYAARTKTRQGPKGRAGLDYLAL